jgi:acetylornithine deacetylase/succinyl-diaminopimelate desuccinylase-like protein
MTGAVQAETLAHLQRLIQFATVNPPGDELALCRHLVATLEHEEIETRLYEPAPGRGLVTARLRGSGALRPVLLLAHTDVVGVTPERWTVPPFGGEVRDGYVYGRGAIDDKGMLAVNLMTVLLLQRRLRDGGARLTRDVVFVATPDEEAGSEWGLQWLLAHHPEELHAEFALNEGGRVRVVDGRPLYAAIQVAEKVPHLVTITARGPTGHAAVPLAGNAITRLGRALAAIGAHQEPLVIGETTRRFFGGLAAVWPHGSQAGAMAEVASDDPAHAERAAALLAQLPAFGAVLRAGISPVLVNGGVRENVIPDHASATLAVRTLPGQALHEVVARMRAAVDDAKVDVAVAHEADDAPSSDADGPLFAALADVMRAEQPGLAVVPYVSTGATDNARLRRAGIPAYGLLPFPLDAEDESRMHGHDERIPVDALHWGVRVVYGTVARVALDAQGD